MISQIWGLTHIQIWSKIQIIEGYTELRIFSGGNLTS